MMRSRSARRGASLTAYAILIGLIAVVALAAVGRMGGSVNGLFVAVGNRLNNTSGGSSGGTSGGGGTVNNAPVFSGSLPAPVLAPNAAMTPVDVSGFSDPDGNSLTFAAIGTWPAGLSLVKQSDSTVRIQGTPTVAGVYGGLVIRVSDGSASTDTGGFTITVEPCAGSPAAGTVCADGSVYAGITPDGNVPIYATRCDAGMVWGGAACTGSRSKIAFNDGSGNWVDTSVTNCTTAPYNAAPCYSGKSNSAQFAVLDSSTVAGTQPHLAAQYCENLVENGKSDWYLPSSYEMLGVMYPGRAAIGGFANSGVNTDRYHSSSEWDAVNDMNPDMSNSDLLTGAVNKASGLNVRCIRR